MLKWFKEAQARRRERARQHEFERGFGWAMARYFLDGWPKEYIEQTVCDNTLRWCVFDDGAMEAMNYVPYEGEPGSVMKPGARNA